VTTALLIVHGLVAVALLGAVTHQMLAAWAPVRAVRRSFFARFRAVRPASYATAIVVLYAVSALLGALLYLRFRTDIRPDLERASQWQALGLFELKEHFAAIGLALLPAYWVCWREKWAEDSSPPPAAALTLILAFIVWWGFLIGHVLNNIKGFGP
jgi:hypothetical protein